VTLIDTPIGPRDIDPEQAAEATFGELAVDVMATPLWESMEASGTIDQLVADLAAVGYDEEELTGAAAAAYDRLLEQTDTTTQGGVSMTMTPQEAVRADAWLSPATHAQRRAVIPNWRQVAGGEGPMRREMAMVRTVHAARLSAEYAATTSGWLRARPGGYRGSVGRGASRAGTRRGGS
jgi:hypothetical protein